MFMARFETQNGIATEVPNCPRVLDRQSKLQQRPRTAGRPLTWEDRTRKSASMDPSRKYRAISNGWNTWSHEQTLRSSRRLASFLLQVDCEDNYRFSHEKVDEGVA